MRRVTPGIPAGPRGGPGGEDARGWEGRLSGVPSRRDRPTATPVALLLAGALALAGCSRAREPQLFELLPPSRTGVTFANRLPDDTAFNILT